MNRLLSFLQQMRTIRTIQKWLLCAYSFRAIAKRKYTISSFTVKLKSALLWIFHFSHKNIVDFAHTIHNTSLGVLE